MSLTEPPEADVSDSETPAASAAKPLHPLLYNLLWWNVPGNYIAQAIARRHGADSLPTLRARLKTAWIVSSVLAVVSTFLTVLMFLLPLLVLNSAGSTTAQVPLVQQVEKASDPPKLALKHWGEKLNQLCKTGDTSLEPGIFVNYFPRTQLMIEQCLEGKSAKIQLLKVDLRQPNHYHYLVKIKFGKTTFADPQQDLDMKGTGLNLFWYGNRNGWRN